MGKMQFWGTLIGRGQQVERGGNKNSGLEVEAAGWKGCIEVQVWHDEMKGADMFRVILKPHWSEIGGTQKEIASGVLDHRALKDPFIPALIA